MLSRWGFRRFLLFAESLMGGANPGGNRFPFRSSGFDRNSACNRTVEVSWLDSDFFAMTVKGWRACRPGKVSIIAVCEEPAAKGMGCDEFPGPISRVASIFSDVKRVGYVTGCGKSVSGLPGGNQVSFGMMRA
jgi:hypothetical protein